MTTRWAGVTSSGSPAARFRDGDRRGLVPRFAERRHAAGVRSIAHIGSSAEAVDTIGAGVDALAHVPWRDELTDEVVAIIVKARVPSW